MHKKCNFIVLKGAWINLQEHFGVDILIENKPGKLMIVCGEVRRSIICCQNIILAEPSRQFGLLGHLVGADFRADLEHLSVSRLK